MTKFEDKLDALTSRTRLLEEDLDETDDNVSYLYRGIDKRLTALEAEHSSRNDTISKALELVDSIILKFEFNVLDVKVPENTGKILLELRGLLAEQKQHIEMQNNGL